MAIVTWRGWNIGSRLLDNQSSYDYCPLCSAALTKTLEMMTRGKLVCPSRLPWAELLQRLQSTWHHWHCHLDSDFTTSMLVVGSETFSSSTDLRQCQTRINCNAHLYPHSKVYSYMASTIWKDVRCSSLWSILSHDLLYQNQHGSLPIVTFIKDHDHLHQRWCRTNLPTHYFCCSQMCFCLDSTSYGISRLAQTCSSRDYSTTDFTNTAQCDL